MSKKRKTVKADPKLSYVDLIIKEGKESKPIPATDLQGALAELLSSMQRGGNMIVPYDTKGVHPSGYNNDALKKVMSYVSEFASSDPASLKPYKLQAYIQEAIGSMDTPWQQLEILNSAQKGLPFMLADPQARTVRGKKSKKTGAPKAIVYGYADLFRFLGYPFTSGVARTPNNPFYKPIKHPVPDVMGNMAFERIFMASPPGLIDRLRQMIDKKGPSGVFYPRTEEYGFILSVINALTNAGNPLVLASLVPGQQHLARGLSEVETLLRDINYIHKVFEKDTSEQKGIAELV